jgi:serine protease
VGATDREGQRAWYSNFGPAVALMAPGGDMRVVGHDGEPNGILSAVYDGTSTWERQEGTSMAAPHVAGVAALLRAVDPDITPAEVAAVLRSTAAPMSASDCNGRSPAGLLAADCGAGLLDAGAALLALGSDPAPPPPPPVTSPRLHVEPDRLDFGPVRTTADLTLRNGGDTASDWSLIGFSRSSSNPGVVGAGVLSVDVGSGRLPAGAARTIRFTLDRDELPRPGTYRLDLVFAVDGEDLIVPVHFDGVEGAAAAPGVDGTLLLVCAPTPTGCDPLRSVETVLRAPGATTAYAVGGLDGAEYVVIGWNDRNGSGSVDAGDLFGFHTRDGDGAATPVTPPASGIDLTLRIVTDQPTLREAPAVTALDALRSWLAAP